jgi:hypothetical protein
VNLFHCVGLRGSDPVFYQSGSFPGGHVLCPSLLPLDTVVDKDLLS